MNRWFFILPLILFFTACGLASPTPPTPPQSGEPLAARINGTDFPQARLERELAIDRATYRLTNGRNLVLQDLAGTLQGLLPSLLLDQQAIAAGLSASEAEVTAALNKYIDSRQRSLQQLEAELTRQGVTLDDFKVTLARNLRVEKYISTLYQADPDLDFSQWMADLRQASTIEIIYQPPQEMPMLGATAPGFTLTNLQGQPVTLSQFRGRPVIINFWATWCVPCRNEMPAFQQAFETHRAADLVILAVNFEEDASLVRPFVEELELTFEILYDTQTTVTQSYQVTGLPRTIFVDRQGVIKHIQVGELTEPLLAESLEKIL